MCRFGRPGPSSSFAPSTHPHIFVRSDHCRRQSSVVYCAQNAQFWNESTCAANLPATIPRSLVSSIDWTCFGRKCRNARLDSPSSSLVCWTSVVRDASGSAVSVLTLVPPGWLVPRQDVFIRVVFSPTCGMITIWADVDRRLILPGQRVLPRFSPHVHNTQNISSPNLLALSIGRLSHE